MKKIKTSSLPVHSDIDECEENGDDCDPDTGSCTNTVGSYDCSCRVGFTGLGTVGTCSGMQNLFTIIIFIFKKCCSDLFFYNCCIQVIMHKSSIATLT